MSHALVTKSLARRPQARVIFSLAESPSHEESDELPAPLPWRAYLDVSPELQHADWRDDILALQG